VNGKQHHEAEVTEPRSELVLPAIKLEANAVHKVKVSAAGDVRAYINFVDPEKAPALVKRLAVQFGKEGLSFLYDKAAPDDVLSLTLWRPFESKERSRIRLRLETPAPKTGPYAGWTFRERVFDVRAAVAPLAHEGRGEGEVPVLGTQKEIVDAGQTVFFPVANDLAPGRYRFHLALDDGPGGYVILSKTIPGAYERLDFFLEQSR
jgi:hypothetical protein